MRIKAFRFFTGLLAALAVAFAPAALAAGDPVYTNTRLLADNLEYVNAVAWDQSYGRTESFAVALTGAGDAYPIVMKGDTIYGSTKISNIVRYAESLGMNVLAAVNADFFFVENGMPIGIVVEDGVYKSSPNGRNAVVFGPDGSVGIIEKPDVLFHLYNHGSGDDGIVSIEGDPGEALAGLGALSEEEGNPADGRAGQEQEENDFEEDPEQAVTSNEGNQTYFRHFNKTRTGAGGMCLYSEVFSTVSTRTSSPGWFVKFRILEGSPSVSGTMELEVVEKLTSDGAIPIGEGYMVLTAADQSGIGSEYEKFDVGDIVTLTTTCSDPRLADARYASGGGDVLVSDGAATNVSGWDQALVSGRAPRTAFGVRADGSVVAYVIDGRNSEHSIGMTLSELADEMLRQGCVYAVNFDGGGSTALSVRLPGNEGCTVVSRPSDGSERGCSTYILFVTDAVPDRSARNLSLQNDGVIVLAESSAELVFAATDSGYMPVAAPADVVAAATDPGASVEGALYTAGSMAGTDRLLLSSSATGASGFGEVYVITRPTSITATRRGGSAPLTSVRVAPGDVFEFDVTATYYRRPVVAQLHSFTYEVIGDIGEMVGPGVFMAAASMLETGMICVSAGGRSIDIRVEIGGFADMEGHWAGEYVESLLQTGITNGISETEYGPELLMRRADFILMLYRAAGQGEPEQEDADEQDGDVRPYGDEPSFDDVDPGAYFADALAWASAEGIADAAEDCLFFPLEPLTRQDAFTFTYRALRFLGAADENGTAEDLEGFPDAGDLAGYAVVPTATLVKLGVVEGMDGVLSPLSTMTRAQMAKVLVICLSIML